MRSDPTYGLNQETPGPGTHEKDDEYEPFKNELRRKGVTIGTGLRTEKRDDQYPGAGTYMPDILEKHVRRTINVEKKNFDRFK
jgi:hypothetical protein